nr:L,D-transpeptidase/peptidoglycan binding protein [Lachnospiraceae bacterium]
MKKVIGITLGVLILIPSVFLAICYGMVRYQYKDTYMPGIFINGVYAADCTPEELNETLKKDTECPEFIVTDKDKNTYTFSLEEISYEQDYLSQLKRIHASQSVIGFAKWFFGEDIKFDEIQIEPDTFYDDAVLRRYLDDAKYLADNSDPKGKKIEIRRDHNGYYLYDETKNLLSHEKAVDAISKALEKGKFETDLYEEDCYIEIDYTSQMQKTLEKWENLARYVESSVTYSFGDKTEVVDRAAISNFIATDENGKFLYDESGSFYLDEDKVKEYVSYLADKYNTVNKPRTFAPTRGGYVTVETGTYGYKINEKTEREYLMNVIGNKNQLQRTPEFIQTNFTNICGEDDIGDTYIEVDLTNQMMYYYKNGDLKINTPVVTGNTSLGRGTPEKVCYVYGKERNRVLRGEGYASFVNFWMPVYGGVGIHDASWRGSYGGKIYKTNGSHGCINTPYAEVSKLYEMVEIGTPVIIFY